ncbi:MAG: MOSC N-terminal beta barrel domain-containing protein [Gammaproteobacteria bacterium]
MRKVGTIKEIWRYPVKGMAGERVERCDLGKKGLAGDRIWALRDTARQEIQSCKFRPELLLCSARCRGGDATGVDDQVDVVFPDGEVLGSNNPAIHAKVSTLTGHASTLEPLRPASDLDFYRRHKRDDHTWLKELKATFEREAGEPLPDLDNLPQSAVDFVSLLGTFFLVTPLHMVTTATLAHLRGLHPQSDWDTRRFRPNLVIETGPGSEGLVEQAWIGKQLVLGDANVVCTETTPRCGAVTRAQRDFSFDQTILRTIVRDADQNVGVYGEIVDSGDLRIGDAVYVRQP